MGTPEAQIKLTIDKAFDELSSALGRRIDEHKPSRVEILSFKPQLALSYGVRYEGRSLIVSTEVVERKLSSLIAYREAFRLATPEEFRVFEESYGLAWLYAYTKARRGLKVWEACSEAVGVTREGYDPPKFYIRLLAALGEEAPVVALRDL